MFSKTNNFNVLQSRGRAKGVQINAAAPTVLHGLCKLLMSFILLVQLEVQLPFRKDNRQYTAVEWLPVCCKVMVEKITRVLKTGTMLKRPQRRNRIGKWCETKVMSSGISAPRCCRAVSGLGMYITKISVLQTSLKHVVLRFIYFVVLV